MLCSLCRSCQTTTNPSPNASSSLTPLKKRWLVILNSCSLLDWCCMNNIFSVWMCSLLEKEVERYQKFNMWYEGFQCKMLMWESNWISNEKSCAVFVWGRVDNLFYKTLVLCSGLVLEIGMIIELLLCWAGHAESQGLFCTSCHPSSQRVHKE